MRPADLLACQADFVQRCDNETFAEILTGSMGGPYMPPEAYRPNEQGIIISSSAARKKWAERVPEWIRFESVRAAQNWARYGMAVNVTEHMVDLLNWVANDFEELDHVDTGLMPAPYGFVHFEKPIKTNDVRGEPLWTDWMIWGPVPTAYHQAHTIGALCFNDMILGPDPQAEVFLVDKTPGVETMLRNIGRWAYSSFSTVYDGERLGPSEWPVDDLVELGYDRNLDHVVPTSNLTRIVYALWVVMNQPIATLEHHHVDRATKRRMERMKIPPQVTVITLRRPENPHRPDTEAHVDWQHHWIVRGHPRWQPYGPHRSERRLIWISPHFKGNLDAPLKQSDKVYVVKR